MASFSYGVAWDDRDDLVNTRRGQFYTARIDLSPGGEASFPYRWARTNVALRGYLPLVRRRLTLAGRLLADFLLGNPPFYELPRYDETSAIGGGTGVRGIPAQRYYGRIKVIGNIELRSELFDFHLFDKDNVFGLVAFFDSGRVFSDYRAEPELDGSGIGLKYGTGLGLRLAAGKSFVLRFDAAWSERAAPSSFYLGSGHIF